MAPGHDEVLFLLLEQVTVPSQLFMIDRRAIRVTGAPQEDAFVTGVELLGHDGEPRLGQLGQVKLQLVRRLHRDRVGVCRHNDLVAGLAVDREWFFGAPDDREGA